LPIPLVSSFFSEKSTFAIAQVVILKLKQRFFFASGGGVGFLRSEMKKYLLIVMAAMVSFGVFFSVAWAQSADLPHVQGKVVGPVDDGTGSSYFLYLPKSLPTERKVPLLFYTHSGGGSARLLTEIVEGAELTGWIMAVSVQSKNGLFIEDCVKYSRNSIEHILKTVPVDKNRIYFTGNSGGGAQAFHNAASIGSCGIMPNVAYLPYDLATPHSDCFILNGGWDYNRYPSAYARKKIGRAAIHRFFDGGHGKAPDWLMVEGMVWLQGRYLAKKGHRVPEEQQFYEQSMVRWMNELKQTEPYRAYYWALFLKNELSLSSENRAAVDELVQTLGKDETNRLYAEGLAAIDEFSLNTLSKFGEGALRKHSDQSVVAACDKLLERYKDVPLIGATLAALRKPTQ